MTRARHTPGLAAVAGCLLCGCGSTDLIGDAGVPDRSEPAIEEEAVEPGCLTDGDCDDGSACTVDICDPASLECVHEELDCDDGDPCTLDGCDPATGCTHEPLWEWFRDGDGDGYGWEGERICAEMPPDGFVDNDLDCCDELAEVNPDHIDYHPEPYACRGASSYDYDCDGIEETRWADLGGCVMYPYATCHADFGWVDTTEIPGCGVNGRVVDECERSMSLCRPTSFAFETQECR
jgi:hypothetical protein